jgi:hypothetical protein
MHVVPVGVDQDLFKPVPGVQRIPGRLITTASADVTMKGLKYLLEALAKLRTERDVSLVIIGRKKEGGVSARTIDELGLNDCVEFVTGVPEERIIELYSEAELAVVPSLYEGFSLPAIEAMSCAVPLVATTGGALPEVVASTTRLSVRAPGDSEAAAMTPRASTTRSCGPASAPPAASASSTAGPGATPQWAPSSTTAPCSPRPPPSRPVAPAVPARPRGSSARNGSAPDAHRRLRQLGLRSGDLLLDSAAATAATPTRRSAAAYRRATCPPRAPAGPGAVPGHDRGRRGPAGRHGRLRHR